MDRYEMATSAPGVPLDALAHTLLRLGARLTSVAAPDAPQAVVEAVVNELRDVDYAVLWLYDPADGLIHFAAMHPAAAMSALPTEPLAPVRLRMGEGCIGRALASDEPLVLPNMAAFARANVDVLDPTRDVIARYLVQFMPQAAFINLPLRVGDVPVGVLELINTHDALPLPTDAIELAHGWAPQLALVLRHAQLHEQLVRQQRQLEAFHAGIAAIADGVVICNNNDEIVLVNDAATTILEGVIPLGMSLHALADAYGLRDLNGAPLPIAQTPLGRAMRGEVLHDYEVLARTSGGRDIVLSTSGAPLLLPNGLINGAVVVLRDVTVHRAQDAARDEFLAVAAHELRAPLAAIKGYTDLLVRRENTRPDATERDLKGIAMLAGQVNHLVLLIDNLLNVSRLDTGRLELYRTPTNLVALVEASVERVRAGDGRHAIEIIGPQTLLIDADQVRLQQVFTNLIANAARYSPPDTPITVEVGTDICRFDAEADAVPCAVVAIRDQGPGIALDVQQHIFDRYYRAPTSTATSGLGLGLYLSREIVMLHGGHLSVESTPGHGATFIVELPIGRDKG